MRCILVFLMVIGLVGSASAQTIYKCQVNGNVIYSGTPCVGNAQETQRIAPDGGPTSTDQNRAWERLRREQREAAIAEAARNNLPANDAAQAASGVSASSNFVSAGIFDVFVTRKANNIYAIDGKSVIIQTLFCYAYAYGEESILKTRGYGGNLIFTTSKQQCDVKAIYGMSKPSPGKYSVTVNRQDEDWYEVLGRNTYVKTSMCLSLALGESAIIVVNANGGDHIHFEGGDDCFVKGFYSPIKL